MRAHPDGTASRRFSTTVVGARSAAGAKGGVIAEVNQQFAGDAANHHARPGGANAMRGVLAHVPAFLVAALGAGIAGAPALPSHAATTQMMSILPDDSVPGGSGGSISADGRFAVFVSGGEIYIRDRQQQSTERLPLPDVPSPTAAPVISGDGNVVAFCTYTQLLAEEGPNNTILDLFAYDRATGHLELVSVGTDGPANRNSCNIADDSNVSINADGNFIAFTSVARNLVVPHDTDDRWDVFRRNRSAGTTEQLNLGVNDAKMLKGTSGAPSISADGKRVAFASNSTALVSPPLGMRDGHIFIRDLSVDPPVTRLVSKNTAGTEANAGSGLPNISDDGCVVAFYSWASNLDPLDTHAGPDVYYRDLCLELTGLVTTDNACQYTGFPAVNRDGSFISFWGDQDCAWDWDTNAVSDVYLWDRATGGIELVSRAADGTLGNNGSSPPTSISDDGSFVAFSSLASNLDPRDTNGFIRDVFLRSLSDVNLVEARYDYLENTLSVKAGAESTQGALTLQGHGEMTWQEASGLWEILVRGLTSPPESVTVCGTTECDSD